MAMLIRSALSLRGLFNAAALLYALVIIWYLAAGPFDYDFGLFRVYAGDLEKPVQIFLAILGARLLLALATYLRQNRMRVMAALMIVFTLMLMAVSGELVVRIAYRNPNSGDPGFDESMFTRSPEGFRWPMVDKGKPKQEGITRIFVQGDSLTLGTPKEWKDLYPYLLLQKLNAKERRYDMHAWARGGMETGHQLYHLNTTAKQVDPDIIIYQWYVNDIEETKDARPRHRLAVWQDFFFRDRLFKYSYLYHFLDHRLPQILPPLDRSYVQYLVDEYPVDSANWFYYRSILHNWATLANSMADKVIVALFPALPFQGQYPLENLHREVKKAVTDGGYLIAAHSAYSMSGVNLPDPSARFKKARVSFPQHASRGSMVYGPYILLAPGHYRVTYRLKARHITSDEPLAVIDVSADKGQRIIAARALTRADFPTENEWKDLILEFDVTGEMAQDVELRVTHLGHSHLYADTIFMPTRFDKIMTLDWTPYTKKVDTWISIFDAHPNEAAMKIMADTLYTALTTGKDPMEGSPGAMVNE